MRRQEEAAAADEAVRRIVRQEMAAAGIHTDPENLPHTQADQTWLRRSRLRERTAMRVALTVIGSLIVSGVVWLLNRGSNPSP